MIPLWDINATRRVPIVTYAILALNLAVFAYMALAPDAVTEAFVRRFAFVPSVLAEGDLLVPRSQGGALGALVTPVTSLFLHGNGMHVGSNLLFLHVFADNVEDVIGRARFVLFYVACGVAACAAQALVDPTSALPMVGASGAISGVLAAYVVLFPGARVVTLVIVFLLEVPAAIFILVWFVFQLVSGLTSLGELVAGGGGVAWFAHLGGFAAGILLMKTWLVGHRAPAIRPLRRRAPQPPWSR